MLSVKEEVGVAEKKQEMPAVPLQKSRNYIQVKHC